MRSGNQYLIEKARRTASHKRAAGILLSCLAFVLTGAVSPCHALDNEKTRASLRGIPGFYLVVEDLRVEIEEDGLTRNEIHRIAGEHLTAAGIRLLSGAEWEETPGSPWLYLYAHVMRRGHGDDRVYVFNISVEVKQRVNLAEKPDSEEIHATTWSRSILGRSAWIEDIKKGVEACIHDFVEAYRSVNGP